MVIKTSSVSWEKRPGDENSSSSSSCSVDVSGKGSMPAAASVPSRKRGSGLISGGTTLPGLGSSGGHEIAGGYAGSRNSRSKVPSLSSSSKFAMAETKGPAGVPAPSAGDDGAGSEDNDDVALTCCDFTMSQAQQTYQRDANRHDLTDNEIMFYKDATPKAEHYMAFRIELPAFIIAELGSNAEIPIEVELVAIVPQINQSQSAVPVDFKDRYEPVPDHQSYLKPCPVRTPGPSQPSMERPVVGVTLAYRVELGSYRQGDRRFAILARLSHKALVEWPYLENVSPCLTPPVYVASKVKRHRQNAASNSSNIDDYKVDGDHRGGSGSGSKGRHDEQMRSPGPHGFAHEIAGELIEPIFGALHERCDRLERIIRLNLIPTIERIERKLATPFKLVEVDDDDDDVPAEKKNGSSSNDRPSTPTQRRTTWTEMMIAMGNGVRDTMHDEAERRAREEAANSDDDRKQGENSRVPQPAVALNAAAAAPIPTPAAGPPPQTHGAT